MGSKISVRVFLAMYDQNYHVQKKVLFEKHLVEIQRVRQNTPK